MSGCLDAGNLSDQILSDAFRTEILYYSIKAVRFIMKLKSSNEHSGSRSKWVLLLGIAAGLAAAWYNLGLALNLNGQAENALNALVKAEKSSPNNPRIPCARATILLKPGRPAEAEMAAKRTLQADPDFSPAMKILNSLNVKRP